MDWGIDDFTNKRIDEWTIARTTPKNIPKNIIYNYRCVFYVVSTHTHKAGRCCIGPLKWRPQDLCDPRNSSKAIKQAWLQLETPRNNIAVYILASCWFCWQHRRWVWHQIAKQCSKHRSYDAAKPGFAGAKATCFALPLPSRSTFAPAWTQKGSTLWALPLCEWDLKILGPGRFSKHLASRAPPSHRVTVEETNTPAKTEQLATVVLHKATCLSWIVSSCGVEWGRWSTKTQLGNYDMLARMTEYVVWSFSGKELRIDISDCSLDSIVSTWEQNRIGLVLNPATIKKRDAAKASAWTNLNYFRKYAAHSQASR